MLRCSCAALSKNTVAAAIARPARTRCLRGHREKKRSSVAHASTVGARRSRRADIIKTSTGTRYVRRDSSCSLYSSKTYTSYLATVQETAKSSAWNDIFNFQRRGPPRRKVRNLLSLCHTHGSPPRSPYLPCQFPNYGSKAKFGARVELRNVLQKK